MRTIRNPARGDATPTGYVPPGWPTQVRPPGAPGWEASAAAFLFDCCPADYRACAVLRRHPVVLARFAAEFVTAQVAASANGLPALRRNLADVVPPEVLQAAVDAWEEQSARLDRVRREVALVEESLRGRVFVRRL